MPTLERAPAEALEIVNEMTEKYHGALRDAELTIDVFFAFAKTDEHGDTESCAVKLHGYPCAAVVKINSYTLRAKGHADAEITIDGDNWDTWTDDQCRALIDHELEHLELKTDKDGLLVRDDLDRPKLRMRKHDHQYGWFDSVARRHGEASLEQQQYDELVASRRQMWFAWEGPAGNRNDSKPEIKDEAEEESTDDLTQEITGEFEKAGVMDKVVKNPGKRRGSPKRKMAPV